MNCFEFKGMDAYNKLVVANAVLDCQMSNVQVKLKSKRKDIDQILLKLNEETEIINKHEEEINIFLNREKNILRNIQGFQNSILMNERLETNLKHQLQLKKQKNELDFKEQREIIDRYSQIAASFLEMYKSLPWTKEKEEQEVNIKKKQIELNQQRLFYKEYMDKISVLNKITKKRMQMSVIDFAALIIERQQQWKETEEYTNWNRKLDEEIIALEEQKKTMFEKATLVKKQQKAVNCLQQRSPNSFRQPYVSPPLSQINLIKSSAAIASIRERLGITNMVFSSPLENPVLETQYQLNSRKETNSQNFVEKPIEQVKELETSPPLNEEVNNDKTSECEIPQNNINGMNGKEGEEEEPVQKETNETILEPKELHSQNYSLEMLNVPEKKRVSKKKVKRQFPESKPAEEPVVGNALKQRRVTFRQKEIEDEPAQFSSADVADKHQKSDVNLNSPPGIINNVNIKKSSVGGTGGTKIQNPSSALSQPVCSSSPEGLSTLYNFSPSPILIPALTSPFNSGVRKPSGQDFTTLFGGSSSQKKNSTNSFFNLFN